MDTGNAVLCAGFCRFLYANACTADYKTDRNAFCFPYAETDTERIARDYGNSCSFRYADGRDRFGSDFFCRNSDCRCFGFGFGDVASK